MTDIRPRRSMLFMPGSNVRALEKAKTLACDGIIFDLEDAVAPDAKSIAREQVEAAVRAGGYGHRELIVRINGLNTPWWRDDLKAVAGLAVAAVLLPKVEDAAVFSCVEKELAKYGGRGTALWAMLETPMAFLRAEEIATASERLKCLVIGTNDLVKDLHGQHTPDRQPVMTALGVALLVARSYGLVALDGVYNDFKDVDGFYAECCQGRALGFDGKTLIHPAQIEAANKVYGPSEAECVEACRIIAAFSAAEAEGKGVAVLDGRMVEDLHVKQALRMLAVAEAIANRAT